MRNKYTGQDLQARLDGTVVRYRRVPYLCSTGGRLVDLVNLPDHKTLFVGLHPDDPDLDISSIELGYFNHEKSKQAIYLKRNPTRQFKQGITVRGLRATPLGTARVNGECIYDEGFLDSCANRYPDYRTALKMLAARGGWNSVALSHECALWRIENDLVKVFLTGEEEGFFSLKSPENVTILKKDTSWLVRSILERNGIFVTHEGL